MGKAQAIGFALLVAAGFGLYWFVDRPLSSEREVMVRLSSVAGRQSPLILPQPVEVLEQAPAPPPSESAVVPDFVNEYRLPERVNPGGLNLVFFADQYPSWEEFESDVNALMSEIKKIEPWKSYALYNVYKINPNVSGVCSVKVADERKPVLRCDADAVNGYLSPLPLERLKLIVLSREEFQSWANVVRLDNSGVFFNVPWVLSNPVDRATHGILFAHMLGHAFGLKDEELFVLAQAGGAPHEPDGPNCAPDEATAREWWGDAANEFPDEVGYFPGCAANEGYIKPTKASIMNLNTGADLVSTYGPVSEQYLKRILDYCFTPGTRSEAASDPVFFERYPDFLSCL